MTPYETALDYKQRLQVECRCRLRPGMTWAQLTKLGSGCQDRYVCPVLDRYRRAVGMPKTEEVT